MYVLLCLHLMVVGMAWMADEHGMASVAWHGDEMGMR